MGVERRSYERCSESILRAPLLALSEESLADTHLSAVRGRTGGIAGRVGDALFGAGDYYGGFVGAGADYGEEG